MHIIVRRFIHYNKQHQFISPGRRSIRFIAIVCSSMKLSQNAKKNYNIVSQTKPTYIYISGQWGLPHGKTLSAGSLHSASTNQSKSYHNIENVS